MAGILGGIMVLLYVYARSEIICTNSSSDVFPDGIDTVVQREVYFPGNTQLLKQSETDAVVQTEEDIEKSIYSNQFSVQKILDGYELTLYDGEGQKIYSMLYPREPWVKEVSEGVLEIGISTGSPARYTFYFRKEDGKISDTFFNAKLFGEQYIAHRPVDDYQGDEPLILTDVFGEGILYQEIYRDFSKTADPMSVISGIELVDETHIRLEYCEGEEYTVINEIVEMERVSSTREPDLKEPYALAYFKFLEEYARDSDYVEEGYARFSLAFIDDNEIPELLLMEDDCHAKGVRVFTY